MNFKTHSVKENYFTCGLVTAFLALLMIKGNHIIRYAHRSWF